MKKILFLMSCLVGLTSYANCMIPKAAWTDMYEGRPIDFEDACEDYIDDDLFSGHVIARLLNGYIAYRNQNMNQMFYEMRQIDWLINAAYITPCPEEIVRLRLECLP